MKRIYLDNAATSWPKPPAVYEAVDRFQREVGAAAGRGAYDSAIQASQAIASARSAVAGLLSEPDPSRVVFTSSGTEALNLAILGLVRRGNHVVTTVCEHNSVLRPLAWLKESAGVEVDYAGCDERGVVDPQEVAKLIRPATKLVVITAASNVTGALQPLKEIGQACRERETLLLVDAAQSLGEIPMDVSNHPIDLLAAPGHKGLLGPLGTGLLWVRPGLEAELRPLMHGGTGTHSDRESPPDAMPQRYESGNLNVPALAGLAAAGDWLRTASTPVNSQTHQLVEHLAKVPTVTLYGPPADAKRGPVISFNIAGYSPQDVAAILAGVGVECRAGLHCAARMHQALGTDKLGGTVRLSPGRFTTDDQIAATLDSIDQLAAAS